MQGGRIETLSARFADPALEAAYRSEAWPILRVQFALALAGLSIGLLITLNSDFIYLTGTAWLAPTAGLRGAAGLAGLALALWLVIARPASEAPVARTLVTAWIGLGLSAAIMVAAAFPAVETTPEGRSAVLVFTAYWISVFTIVVGFSFFAYPRAVAVFCGGLAVTYLSLAAAYWTTGDYPKISQSVLVVMACAFGWIMALVTGVRTRRRFHLTRLYEEARTAAEQGRAFQTFLLAATGHDMRQPVYALDLNAAALEAASQAGDLERTRMLARRQRQVARNVTGMLSSILRLSQMDTGRAAPSPEPTRAGALIAETIEPLRDLAADRGIEIRLVRSQLEIMIDRGVAAHILSNLAANAIAHSGARRLVCGVRRRKGAAEIVMADDGEGLAPRPVRMSALSDVLDEAAGARRTGLGMEIMFRLAERGGLTLQLRSEPGRGVCAALQCPQARGSTAGVVFPAAERSAIMNTVAGGANNAAIDDVAG